MKNHKIVGPFSNGFNPYCWSILLNDGALLCTDGITREAKSGTDLTSFYFKSKGEAENAIKAYYSGKPMNTSSLEDAYNLLHENCGIKVGDTVRLVRAPLDKEMGCPVIGYSEADAKRLVGEKATITKKDKAFWLRFEELDCSAFAPFFCLELISSKKEFIEVTLNGSYTAKVYKDKVVVGCQEFPIKKLSELNRAANKLSK